MNRRHLLTAGVGAGAAALGAGVALWRRQPANGPAPGAAALPGDAGALAALWAQRFARPEGGEIDMASLRGKPLLINFWATWCAPCRREIPLLNEIREQRHATEGVEIVGIAVDFRDEVLKYIERTRIAYPLLMGEEDGLRAANAFGMDLLLPFTVFADQQRRIVTVKVGELHADEADFILDQIAALNAGQRDLAAVRLAIAAKLTELAAERARRPAETSPGTAA